MRTYVIALGGNAILRAGQKGTVEEQLHNLNQTGRQLLELLGGRNRVVITHGNGPQVGNLLLALEAAKEVPSMSLDVCGAATQGFMGYMIQQTLANCLRENGLAHKITTVISQVIVDENDPAFGHPTKPIGPFYALEEAMRLGRERGWQIIKDATRGYRRVVASPEPLEIQQARIIRSMLDAGESVIAVGGGGIPVIRNPDRSLRGVEAVIDKDLASARLGLDIEADVLLILTAVENVFVDFGRPLKSPCILLRSRRQRRCLGKPNSGSTGIGDGSILSIDPASGETRFFANTGGRPLGVTFDAAGDTLYVPDAKLGLLSVDRAGSVRVLANEADGEPATFADNLDVAGDGTVWFSAPTREHTLEQVTLDVWHSCPTGRLLRYDPQKKSAHVVLDNLFYANGVAIAQDASFVLVAEFLAFRITRYWLKGEREGTHDVFVDGLPGYPANITRTPDGNFLVGLSLQRLPGLDKVRPYPWNVKVIYRLPAFMKPKPQYPGYLMEFDPTGRLLRW